MRANLADTSSPQPELSPARAQLAYLLEQQAERAGKRSDVTKAHERLKDAERAEVDAKAALAALDAAEAAAMGAWAREGGDMPQPDAEQRRTLSDRLSAATAQANAARAAGLSMLDEARSAQAELADIATEIQGAILGVLAGSLDPVFAELADIEAQRRALIAKAVALLTLFRDGADRFAEPNDPKRISILKRVGDLQGRIKPYLSELPVISNGEVESHKAPFIALSAQLASDPRAEMLEG